MELAVVGVNHQTAGIADREQLVLDGADLDAFYVRIARETAIDGVVVLSTCNRTEIYWAGAASPRVVLDAWTDVLGRDADSVSHLLMVLTGERTIGHLFRVASGLDSMMLGESEILGQVKTAYRLSQDAGRAGSLHRLFLAAIRVGKRTRRETAISDHALSMGFAAVELVRKVYGHDMDAVGALVVGAGEMGTLAARHLRSSGVGRMQVVNRTKSRGDGLAHELGAESVPWAELPEALCRADVVVSCTRAHDPVIRAADVARAVRGRRGRPLILMDLAVPRDVEPAVDQLGDAVFRYDVDDLAGVVAENRRRREQAVAQVEQLLTEEAAAFLRELDVTAVAPVIRSLRDKAERIRQAELAHAWDKLPGLSDEERAVVDRATRLMLNRLLNDPMVSIRGWASQPEGPVYLDALRELFRLDEGARPATDED